MFEFIKKLFRKEKPPERTLRDEWAKYTYDLSERKNTSPREFIDAEQKAYNELYETLNRIGEKYHFQDVEELVKQAVREYKENRRESSTGN